MLTPTSSEQVRNIPIDEEVEEDEEGEEDEESEEGEADEGNFSDLSALDPGFGDHKLLDYAFNSLPEHVRQVSEDDSETQKFHSNFADFLSSQYGQYWANLFWLQHDPWQWRKQKRRHPLHIATALGLLQTLKAIFPEENPDVRDEVGVTPLGIAASTGRIDIVNLLLTAGADIDCRQGGGETALHISAWHGYKEVVRHLLSHGADSSIRDDGSNRALELAAEAGSHAVIDVLLEHGDQLNTESQVRTALHASAGAGRLETVKKLEGLGATVNAIDWQGQTPLYVAMLRNRHDCVRHFLDSGCLIPDRLLDDSQHTFHFAADRGCEPVISFWLGQNLPDINMVNE
jgi:ankyrin repeat protein